MPRAHEVGAATHALGARPAVPAVRRVHRLIHFRAHETSTVHVCFGVADRSAPHCVGALDISLEMITTNLLGKTPLVASAGQWASALHNARDPRKRTTWSSKLAHTHCRRLFCMPQTSLHACPFFCSAFSARAFYYFCPHFGRTTARPAQHSLVLLCRHPSSQWAQRAYACRKVA